MSLSESIWTVTTPIRFFGTWFPHVMTIVRLCSDDIVLHSPCRPSARIMKAIDDLGAVAHVVAPNWFHDLYLAQYRHMYPNATFWAPPLLQRRHRSLIDVGLNQNTRPPWFNEMPHTTLSGLLSFDECVFFHRSSKTLIVADLLVNASASSTAPLLTRLGYRFLGLDGSLKVFPVLRWFGFTSRPSMRRTARQVLEWEPDSLVVGHGTPLRQSATPQLRQALAWLI